MKILQGVNLEKAFELLKNELLECESISTKNSAITGLSYAEAYGKLSGTVKGFICGLTDTGWNDMEDEMSTARGEDIKKVK